MTDHDLDVRRSLRLLRRHRWLLAVAALLGLAGGLALAAATPPLVTATAQVVLPGTAPSDSATPSRDVQTQVAIARSATVLSRAAEAAGLSSSFRQLQRQVAVTAPTPDILAVTAQAPTARGARALADAVADAYVAYAWSADAGSASAAARSPGVTARVLEYSPDAVRPSPVAHLATFGLAGAAAAWAVAALGVLFLGRRDTRLRLRDEIADAVGLPVIASVATARPRDAGGWSRLLEEYRPAPVDAWSLRKLLRQLGAAERRPRSVVTVVSLAGDVRALAVGPQLASFAADRDVPTALLLATQDPAAATLRTACLSAATDPPDRDLVVLVPDGTPEPPTGRALTVVVAVVTRESPRLPATPAGATVLAVSAGFATADDLARVAVVAADADRDLAGLVVCDPDPEDRTSGLVAGTERPTAGELPRRTTGIARTAPR